MAARLEKADVLIIGAGISGLLVAQALTRQGWPVTLLEKSPGLGGRLATRRTTDGPLDHGLDVISADHVNEQPWCALEKAGVLFPSTPSKKSYVSALGMSALAKKVAAGLNIQKQSRATKLSIAPGASQWRIAVEGKSHLLTASHVILTAPVPQVLEMLEASFPQQLKEWVNELSTVTYDKALVLLGKRLGTSSALPKKPLRPFEKIIDNAAKGLTTTPGLMTVVARPEFSKKWFSRPDKEIISEMRKQLTARHAIRLTNVQLKKWRYSQAVTPLKKAYTEAPMHLPLYLIGDGFAGGGLAGAVNSAHALAAHLGHHNKY